jgi:hypothetical protein
MKPARKLALRTCAAAVFGAFSLGALGQVESAYNQGVLAALERAGKTPLEIVWLRAAAENEMWNKLAMVEAVQRCGKLGSPREGCAVLGRTAFRYVFGGNTPATDGAARLIVSSLNLPGAGFASGRLSLSGSGRIYVITPESEAGGTAPASGAIVLAAGTSVQLVDVAYPAIQVELKAPANETLLLGSLVGTDLSKALALLVGKPGASASEASVDNAGRIALRSSGEVQFALLAPAQNDAQPTLLAAIAPVKPLSAEEIVFTQDLAQLAGAIESTAPASFEFILTASLAPIAGMTEGEVLANIAAARIQIDPANMALSEDFTRLAAAVEATGSPASAEFTLVASLAPIAGMIGGETLANAAAARIQIAPEQIALTDDYTKLAGVLETSTAPASSEFILAASLAPIAGMTGGEALANTAATRIQVDPEQMALAEDFSTLTAAVEATGSPASAEFTLVASLAPTQDYIRLAGALEASDTPASSEFILNASLASIAGMMGAETLISTAATRIQIDPEQMALPENFTRLAAAIEATVSPASAEFTLMASLALVADMAGGEALANAAAARIELKPEQLALTGDFTKLTGAIEGPNLMASAEFTLSASLASVIGMPGGEILANALATAVTAPARPEPMLMATSSATSDLARMRAEIEAEVARERERMAQTLQNRPAAKRFVFGT